MKSPGSTAGKVARKRRGDASARRIVDGFTDTLRYTLCAEDHDEIVPAGLRMLAGLTAQRIVVTEVCETYRDGAPYKGVHVLCRYSPRSLRRRGQRSSCRCTPSCIHTGQGPAAPVLRGGA